MITNFGVNSCHKIRPTFPVPMKRKHYNRCLCYCAYLLWPLNLLVHIEKYHNFLSFHVKILLKGHLSNFLISTCVVLYFVHKGMGKRPHTL